MYGTYCVRAIIGIDHNCTFRITLNWLRFVNYPLFNTVLGRSKHRKSSRRQLGLLRHVKSSNLHSAQAWHIGRNGNRDLRTRNLVFWHPRRWIPVHLQGRQQPDQFPSDDVVLGKPEHHLPLLQLAGLLLSQEGPLQKSGRADELEWSGNPWTWKVQLWRSRGWMPG